MNDDVIKKAIMILLGILLFPVVLVIAMATNEK